MATEYVRATTAREAMDAATFKPGDLARVESVDVAPTGNQAGNFVVTYSIGRVDPLEAAEIAADALEECNRELKQKIAKLEAERAAK